MTKLSLNDAISKLSLNDAIAKLNLNYAIAKLSLNNAIAKLNPSDAKRVVGFLKILSFSSSPADLTGIRNKDCFFRTQNLYSNPTPFLSQRGNLVYCPVLHKQS